MASEVAEAMAEAEVALYVDPRGRLEMSEKLRHPELIYNDGSLTWEQKASELLDAALSAGRTARHYFDLSLGLAAERDEAFAAERRVQRQNHNENDAVLTVVAPGHEAGDE